ncbi:hypothetical protein GCM10028857_22280 [Salinarchaeum chitinilyticum]
MSDGPFETTFQVGEIVDAAPFEEARTEALVKLEIDLGEETVYSAAQPDSTTISASSPVDRCSVRPTSGP